MKMNKEVIFSQSLKKAAVQTRIIVQARMKTVGVLV